MDNRSADAAAAPVRKVTRSRRELLAGAAGALGVLAAESLARVPAAQANDGDPILAGRTTTANGVTQISNTGLGSGLLVFGDGSGTGVLGSGGSASGSIGVWGQSTGGTGVYGVSTSIAGGATAILGRLVGTSPGAFSSAVRGQCDGTGGLGIGVYGSQAGSGYGVYGTTPSGIGVNGASDSGTGVYAQSTTGTALQVTGRANFSTAGTAVIASGKKSVTVTLAGVTTSDVVLATVQGSGSFYVKNASAGSGQFTITINKAPTAPATVTVAYFVISA